jgi:carotenoid 1,2-hydratase
MLQTSGAKNQSPISGNDGRDQGVTSGFPAFNMPVGNNGYAWWYLDGLSDDGQHGFTIIGLIGSVFSPYYAFSRRKQPADPFNHVAMNVALYGAAGKRWAMTERGRGDIATTAESLAIGPSAMRWDGRCLTVNIDEVTVPFPRRLRGKIQLYPAALQTSAFALDTDGDHIWQPIAPIAKVEVAMTSPSLTWKGHGYFDHNAGACPLEYTFQKWHWSRANTGAGATVFYDVTPRQGGPRGLAVEISRTGIARDISAPPIAKLPSTLWRIGRATRSSDDVKPRVVATLEDTPFYARSVVSNGVGGIRAVSMHESLDLDRFRMPIVQAMLPFRMPRRAR